ncbi:Fatty acid synthase [Trachymyrmex zeteki]|uniref:Fatty acid synthase n=1 Tax=Mycetomoellerius zeteki TaxID=64791 RepID=A0A151WMM7_9HYME|nr:Fatty acid synthase [Trachymyrmex zeteki]
MPEGRMLLEHSYEAIIDTGINPKQLRGKDTAVIIATSYIEAQEKFLYKNYQAKEIIGADIQGESLTSVQLREVLINKLIFLTHKNHTIPMKKTKIMIFRSLKLLNFKKNLILL